MRPPGTPADEAASSRPVVTGGYRLFATLIGALGVVGYYDP